jgi:hypothetical protein
MDSYPPGIQLGFCFGEIQKVVGLRKTHFGNPVELGDVIPEESPIKGDMFLIT